MRALHVLLVTTENAVEQLFIFSVFRHTEDARAIKVRYGSAV